MCAAMLLLFLLFLPTMDSESVKNFFEEFTGDTAPVIAALPASGSARKNFTASANGKNFIITYNSNLRENETFFYLSEVFSDLSLNTPEILKISDHRKLYIQQNVGESTLSEIIANEGTSERVKNLLRKTLKRLFELQNATKEKIDFTKTFEYEKYDRLPVVHDLYYFKNYFADILENEYHRGKLLKEFLQIAEIIENIQPRGLMLRDFQARNILVNEDDEVFFIDYQGAMEGPLLYDVVSLLYQAKANLSEEERDEFLNFYLNLYSDGKTRENLKSALPYLKLMRFLQVLGAYGFRGLIQKKPHFIASIPLGLANLKDFTESWSKIQDFPELHSVIHQLDDAEFRQKIKKLTHGT